MAENTRLVDKPDDVIILLSNGGFNDALLLVDLVTDVYTRYKRIYVMNIQKNPSTKKYIKEQIEYCKGLYVGTDIRYFGISDLPEDAKDLSIKDLIELYVNPAILEFFDLHFECGSDVQIYLGFDKTTYVDIEFNDQLKDIVHYPYKDKDENYSIDELMTRYHGLFRLCTTCENATEEKQWCGNEECYDCMYIKHKASYYNFFNIRDMVSWWLREDMQNWFDLKLPANYEEVKEIQSSGATAGCGCVECVGNSETSFAFMHDNNTKKIVYGNRTVLRNAFDDMAYGQV